MLLLVVAEAVVRVGLKLVVGLLLLLLVNHQVVARQYAAIMRLLRAELLIVDVQCVALLLRGC